MRKYSIVVLFGLLVLPSLVACSALPPTNQQMNKLELSFEQPNNINNSSFDSKIVGGVTAAVGQFPHMVSLRRNDRHFCGGSIISDRWILTAAHCFYGNPQLASLSAVVGTNTLNAGGTVYRMDSIIIHESYDTQTLANDIAVLRVDSQMYLSSTVKKIRLALLNPAPSSLTTLSGWGMTSYPDSIPNDLQYINLPTIDMITCASMLGVNAISTGNLCTLSPGKGGCHGDAGGPLIMSGVQVGILSWGIRCDSHYPEVYTSVAFYRLWILLKTGILL